jgi:hypothetical protein
VQSPNDEALGEVHVPVTMGDFELALEDLNA